MTPDFYFTVTSWFPGNVRVKPYSKHSWLDVFLVNFKLMSWGFSLMSDLIQKREDHFHPRLDKCDKGWQFLCGIICLSFEPIWPQKVKICWPWGYVWQFSKNTFDWITVNGIGATSYFNPEKKRRSRLTGHSNEQTQK